MKMQIFIGFGIALCILHYVTCQEEPKSEDFLNEDEQACIVDTEISEAIVVEAKETMMVYADDPKYKEFMSCCWKRYGYQKEDGEMNWEKLKEVLGESFKPAVVEILVKKCDDIHGKTDGDTVALVLYCLDEHAPHLRAVHGHYGAHREN